MSGLVTGKPVSGRFIYHGHCRATKIVATLALLDPGTARGDDPSGCQRGAAELSHGKAQDHIDRAATVPLPPSVPGAKWPSWPTCRSQDPRGKFADGAFGARCQVQLDASRTEPGDINGGA